MEYNSLMHFLKSSRNLISKIISLGGVIIELRAWQRSEHSVSVALIFGTDSGTFCLQLWSVRCGSHPVHSLPQSTHSPSHCHYNLLLVLHCLAEVVRDRSEWSLWSCSGSDLLDLFTVEVINSVIKSQLN